MKEKKEKKKLETITNKVKGNKVFLSALLIIILIIIIGIVLGVTVLKPKASNAFILKEKSFEINENKIKITYTIKNDHEEEKEIDSIFIDLKDKDGNIIGGYLVAVDQTFKAGKKQEYTIERLIPATGEIKSLSFRCPNKITCK